jgi:hypothetical protein
MTYDEVIALSESNKYSLGMTPEEIAKRDNLIRVVAEYNPDMAHMIARGPYRSTGQSSLGASATPQEAWSRGANDTSVSDRLRGVPQTQNPPAQSPAPQGGPIMGAINTWRGGPTPSTTGPAVPGTPPPRSTNTPYQSEGSLAPSGSRETPVNINIYSGPQPQQGQAPDWTSPEARSFLDQAAGPPGGMTNGMYQPPPPMGPPGGRSSMNMPLSGMGGFMTPQGWSNPRVPSQPPMGPPGGGSSMNMPLSGMGGFMTPQGWNNSQTPQQPQSMFPSPLNGSFGILGR